jgi:hypothetical protein
MNMFAIHKPLLQLPVIAGTIQRRLLVNFRCRPDVLQHLLPAPFRPKLIRGWGIAGICLIRLGGVRPAFLGDMGGFSSENAAHRIAVEWDEDGATREGVFIPRRDTNALLNRLIGGRFFPGVHHAAEFRASETENHFELEMRSKDGVHFVCVKARVADGLPGNSIFASLDEASEFFRAGALGWSVREKDTAFDGLELDCREWKMELLAVDQVESSFFGDRKLFPEGAAVFDSAFLMRNIPHVWNARGRLATL